MMPSMNKYSMNKENLYSNISMSKKKERLRGLLAMRANMKREKGKAESESDKGGLPQSGKKHGVNPVNRSVKRRGIDGRTYKNLFKLAGKKAKLTQGGDRVAEVDERVVKSSCLGSRRQRVCLNPEKGVSIGNAEPVHESFGFPLVDSGECETASKMDECAEGVHRLESQLGGSCAICMGGGELLLCSGKGCGKSFHLSCFNPPLLYASRGLWHCNWCTKKKIESGVHSVSEGIESILNVRDVVVDDEEMPNQKQYLVKYKSLAHVHNRWLLETQLIHEAPNLLSKFKKNYRPVKWDAEWCVPHRLIKRRPLIFSQHNSNDCRGTGDTDPDCQYEWLVKWTGLNYDRATWELENSSFFMTPETVMLKKKLETRNRKYAVSHPSEKCGAELSEFPFEVSTGVHDYLLPYLNKLRDYWHRSQNAVLFDGQDRFVKVVFFILSLLGNVKQPFLIVAASSALSFWEAAFSNWSSLVDVVTYKGNKDVRAIIRKLEFYNEDGCIGFDVLLSSLDIIVEDLEVLRCIKWEVIIMDECQRPSMRSNRIKMLEADMKLLTISGETLDRRLNYQHVLSLLDPKYEAVAEDADLETPPVNNNALKEKLSPFIVFQCKFSSPKFKEYWVPVRLSRMQIEQYCSLLHSNSTSLCSPLRKTSASSLHEILTLTRKCCDHPYFLDPTLQNSCIGGHSDDPLNSEINVSGKLQLLDKILSEIKKRGLRVLVLFQSLVGSTNISVGDILDDLVHRRFGQESYARFQGEISPSKKQAALNLFNSREGTQFVCLLDYRACHPSIKLSSMDVVILFDSDWNPLNDLKTLQRITIDSQWEQLRVFRLYSSFTVEEKVLIHTKEGTILDSKNTNINRVTCHLLLAWGASYLFEKLRSYGDCKTPESESDDPCGESLSEDVVQELVALLPDKSGSNNTIDCSIILNVQQNEGAYPKDILLLGEVEARLKDNFPAEKELIESEPHVFWTNILRENHHKRKRSSKPSQRIRMSVQIPDDVLEKSESENAVKNCREVVNDRTSDPCVKKMLRSNRKVTAKVKRSKLAARRRSKGSSWSFEHVNSNCSSDFLSMPCIPENDPLVCGRGEEPSSRGNATEIEKQNGECTRMNEEMLNSDSRHMTQEQFGMGQGMFPTPEQAEVQRESLSGNLPEPSSRSFMQPTAQLPISSSSYPSVIHDSVAPNVSSMNCVTESQNNHPSVTLPVMPRVFQSSSNDPLEKEMERIQRNSEQAARTHQERKLMLLSECEKEILEIHKKYDALIQESEMVLMKQTEVLEREYQVVHANKLLAEVLAQTYDAYKAGQPKGTEQAASSSRILEIPAPKLLPAGNPCSSGISTIHCSGNSLGGTGLLQIPTSTALHAVNPSSISIHPNSLGGTVLRAPAPHLRGSRPLPSASFNNLQYSMSTIPEQSLLEPLHTTSLPADQLTQANTGIYHQQGSVEELPELPIRFDSVPDLDCPDVSLLGSNYRAC